MIEALLRITAYALVLVIGLSLVYWGSTRAPTPIVCTTIHPC